ncbi:hypothetical protein DFH06DRAFT_1140105 [Mycena polygramma]|nr:hypothetical protein DFH06DRAFT_1140105 [Mycena polygramma]
MLARMKSHGVRTLANARYGEDFDSVRKCTVDGGSLFLYKKMPETVHDVAREFKGSLGNYVGHIFGEVDRVFTLAGASEDLLRLKLPTDASCDAVRLWFEQDAVMKQVIARDDARVVRAITETPSYTFIAANTSQGGSVKDSFFDYSTTYPVIAPVPNTFFVAIAGSPSFIKSLKKRTAVVIEVFISRYDREKPVTGQIERSRRIRLRRKRSGWMLRVCGAQRDTLKGCCALLSFVLYYSMNLILVLAQLTAWLPPLPALPLESPEADRLLGSLTAGDDYELCLRSRRADSKTFVYESKARQAMRAFVMGRISEIRDFDENTQTLTLRNLARATDKARTYFYNDVWTLKDTIRSESSRVTVQQADATREWCYEDPGNDAESVVYVECGPLVQLVNGPLAVGLNVLVDVSLHRRDLYFDKFLSRVGHYARLYQYTDELRRRISFLYTESK